MNIYYFHLMEIYSREQGIPAFAAVGEKIQAIHNQCRSRSPAQGLVDKNNNYGNPVRTDQGSCHGKLSRLKTVAFRKPRKYSALN